MHAGPTSARVNQCEPRLWSGKGAARICDHSSEGGWDVDENIEKRPAFLEEGWAMVARWIVIEPIA
jgi:hypothetical protein